MSNTKKFVAVAAAAFAFAFSATIASAVSASAIYTPASGYLKVGSGMGAKAYQAPNVVAAQQALNACTGSHLAEDGKFGPLTTGVFKAFQQSKGIKVDGVIGPETAATLAACSGSSTSSNDNGGSVSLHGDAGDLADANLLGTYSNEKVMEGESDAKVLAIELEADNGSDLAIQNFKINLTMDGSGSTRPNKYMDKVTVWEGTKEVGSADISDFTKNGTDYSKNISLSNAVVKDGQKAKFYVSVDALENIDSGDLGQDWLISVDSVRFSDASGAVITSTDYELGDTVAFSFEDLATSGDLEAKLSKASDSPAAQVVEADSTSDTNGVSLLKFKIKAEGSDMTIDNMVLSVESSGADIDEIAKQFTLSMDGNEIDSIDSSIASTSGTINFTDLEDDISISEGDTVEFEVAADINDFEGAFNAGDTLKVSFTGANFDDTTCSSGIECTVINDGNDDSVGSSDRSGSALGETQTFYENGLMFSLVSTSASVTTVGDASATTPTSDTGTFTIKYKLTAFGSNISVDKDCVEDGSQSADEGVSYIITNGSNIAATSCSVSSTADTNPDDSNAWLIEDGSSETFTLTVAGTATADTFAKVYLEAINYDEDTTDTSPDQFFMSDIGEDTTSTNEIYLNDN